MNELLDNQLCSKYPKIFVNRFEDVENSCIAFGFEVGDGWFNIIDQLCSIIQYSIDDRNRCIAYAVGRNNENPNKKPLEVPEPIPQVVASQVKEKFGSLRFYFDGGNDQIYDYVRMAEALSGVTCEQCGCPGDVTDNGWIRVLCDKHAKERAERK